MPQGCVNSHFIRSNALTIVSKLMPALLLALALVGCESSEKRSEPIQGSNDSIYKYSAYRYQYPPTPPVLSSEDLREFVEQYRHNTVVLEFWASWSPSSRDDLAPLSEMQEDLRGDGVRVIACTFDDDRDWSNRVVPILQSVRANFPCVVIPKSARSDIREWLGVDWSYEIPARFVLDPTGRVTGRFYSGTPFANVRVEAQRQSAGRGEIAKVSASSTAGNTLAGGKSGTSFNVGGATTLTARLVNVTTGEAESLPIIYSSNGNSEIMGGELATYIADRLNRATNQRIALMPFSLTTDRTRPSDIGTAIAANSCEVLRKKGFYDLMGPAAADRMVADAGLSALSIDYDPTLAMRSLGVDFLVVGWIKTDAAIGGNAAHLALDSSDENPGAN